MGIAVYATSLGCAALGALYVARDLRSDLVLLGGALLVSLVWLLEAVALTAVDISGSGSPDRVLLYGYLLTGVLLPIGGGYLSLMERSRWGSAAILVAVLTMPVLQMRLAQMWPGGFAS
ncbi:hypothetical protein KRX56_04945 [Dermabacteraceae bacterium TAE3-ERU27]|nr:hypothetical protein [Dermabacteraceae bacterium TAE3-ERU27]